ncbi:hypothetical protein B484DRAFT_431257 [Ochromonadaceae sp. CCMP2298]|nr:hypothetical protein B484DRAFT_431257 [Ochromonadaceae sp. CCMP2298]
MSNVAHAVAGADPEVLESAALLPFAGLMDAHGVLSLPGTLASQVEEVEVVVEDDEDSETSEKIDDEESETSEEIDDEDSETSEEMEIEQAYWEGIQQEQIQQESSSRSSRPSWRISLSSRRMLMPGMLSAGICSSISSRDQLVLDTEPPESEPLPTTTHLREPHAPGGRTQQHALALAEEAEWTTALDEAHPEDAAKVAQAHITRFELAYASVTDGTSRGVIRAALHRRKYDDLDAATDARRLREAHAARLSRMQAHAAHLTRTPVFLREAPRGLRWLHKGRTFGGVPLLDAGAAHETTTRQLGDMSRELGAQLGAQAKEVADRLAAIEAAARTASSVTTSATIGSADSKTSESTRRGSSRAPVRSPAPLVALGTPPPSSERRRLTHQSLDPRAESGTQSPFSQYYTPPYTPAVETPPPLTPQWLQDLTRVPSQAPHIRKYLEAMATWCSATDISALPELMETCVRADLAAMGAAKGRPRQFPSWPIANDSTERRLIAWDLLVTDDVAEYIVDGSVPARGQDGNTLYNWTAKLNEHVHDATANTFRFAEQGVMVGRMMHRAETGTVELSCQYDGGRQDLAEGEEKHYLDEYNWDVVQAPLLHRVAALLFRVAFKFREGRDMWLPHFAEVLDTVDRLCTTGNSDLAQYRRILSREEEATTLVQAEIALMLQVVDGRYAVDQYCAPLSLRESRGPTSLHISTPTQSMLLHVLYRLPVFTEHVQFRVADHPEHPKPTHYQIHWDEALVDHAQGIPNAF